MNDREKLENTITIIKNIFFKRGNKNNKTGSDCILEGWIKLHRKIQDCFLWNEKPYDKARAWIDLLILAMYVDKKFLLDGTVITIPRGSFMTSRLKLADRWGWSAKKVDAYLKLLENEKMVITDRTTKGTTITIVNYEQYQILGSTEDTTDGAAEVTTKDIAEDTQNKNIKKINNDICPNNKDKQIAKDKQSELKHNFDIIYNFYPKKVGKANGFDKYKAWVTSGRMINGSRIKLTNKQIWKAIANYKRKMEEDGQELQFYKNFDTFMNKAIIDYVEDEN